MFPLAGYCKLDMPVAWDYEHSSILKAKSQKPFLRFQAAMYRTAGFLKSPSVIQKVKGVDRRKDSYYNGSIPGHPLGEAER